MPFLVYRKQDYKLRPNPVKNMQVVFCTNYNFDFIDNYTIWVARTDRNENRQLKELGSKQIWCQLLIICQIFAGFCPWTYTPLGGMQISLKNSWTSSINYRPLWTNLTVELSSQQFIFSKIYRIKKCKIKTGEFLKFKIIFPKNFKNKISKNFARKNIF